MAVTCDHCKLMMPNLATRVEHAGSLIYHPECWVRSPYFHPYDRSRLVKALAEGWEERKKKPC